jgi:AraC-like DNA-binding protein
MNADLVLSNTKQSEEFTFRRKGEENQAKIHPIVNPLRRVTSPDFRGSAPARLYQLKPYRGGHRHSLFVERITDLLEIHIDDERYGIQEICKDAGISRAQLHRNLKKFTGRSTSKFIRAIRLRKAKDLLLSTDLNITQVAFEVGFNDPKYFTRVFSEEFDRSPREFRKSLEHV